LFFATSRPAFESFTSWALKQLTKAEASLVFFVIFSSCLTIIAKLSIVSGCSAEKRATSAASFSISFSLSDKYV